MAATKTLTPRRVRHFTDTKATRISLGYLKMKLSKTRPFRALETFVLALK